MSLRSIKSEEFFIDADMREWANAEMLKTGRRIDWKRIHPTIGRMPHEHIAVPVGEPGRLHPTEKPKDIPLIFLNGALYQWYMTTIDATIVSEQTPKEAVVAFLMNISPGHILPDRWLDNWTREDDIIEDKSCEELASFEFPERVEQLNNFQDILDWAENVNPPANRDIGCFTDKVYYAPLLEIDTEDPVALQLLREQEEAMLKRLHDRLPIEEFTESDTVPSAANNTEMFKTIQYPIRSRGYPKAVLGVLERSN